MNLHGIASAAVGTVNPFVDVAIRVSTGYAIAIGGEQVPSYATPGAITASIAADVLTVSAIASGKLSAGQTIAGAGITTGTKIVAQLTGAAGGVGTYRITPAPQTVASGAVTTAFSAPAQIQSLTYSDLMKMDGLNIQGQRRALYLNGRFDGVVRPALKGGDLVTFPDGTKWLVAMVLEYWPDWCKIAVTLQDDGA